MGVKSVQYPEYFLDYREILDPSIRWTDKLESSSGEWSGNLVDFFFEMERKLLRDIKKPFQLEGITRIDETAVHKAIREALANCITNADFNFSRGIVILKKPDGIIIENPGSIITGKAQMIKGGVSEQRNKAIMKMFNLIHIGERAGSGVPDIFSAWAEAGWIPPTVEELYNPDRTIMSLSFEEKQAEKTGGNGKQAETENRRKKQAEKTGGNKNQIIDFIAREGIAKSSDIAIAVSLSPSRIRALLSELLDEGKIETSGAGRSRRYALKSSPAKE